MIKALILDLDGTVYTGRAAVPGAADFVVWARQAGVRCLFVTNRANRAPEEICAQLATLGMPSEPRDVLTSAQATARCIGKASVFCIGENGMLRELEAAGATLVRPDHPGVPEYVVVSFDREFTYAKLKLAAGFIHAGAKYVATNPDAFLKTEHGTVPGTGAIVAAVSAATGAAPLVIGKPGRLIVDMALRRLGASPGEALVVGDNVTTDIAAGGAAGVRTALILTGVSRREDAPAAGPARPTWIVASYAELQAVIAAENRRNG
ncbi:MAG: HAD-IIA family hydrolase [Lentisphaerae bacterium]|nr:HAD-IIA family hydrolase [Lentisphaerota bacterium]